jgi:hypothetical protein
MGTESHGPTYGIGVKVRKIPFVNGIHEVVADMPRNGPQAEEFLQVMEPSVGDIPVAIQNAVFSPVCLWGFVLAVKCRAER